MKKIFAAMTVTVLLLSSISTTVFAHGRGGKKSAAQTTLSLCAVENCQTVGNHIHDNTTYAGHYYGDGHDYHELCSAANCYLTESHEHDGVYCLPNNNNGYGQGRGCGGCRNRY